MLHLKCDGCLLAHLEPGRVVGSLAKAEGNAPPAPRRRLLLCRPNSFKHNPPAPCDVEQFSTLFGPLTLSKSEPTLAVTSSISVKVSMFGADHRFPRAARRRASEPRKEPET